MSKELNIIEAMHMKLGTEFTIKYRDGYTRRVMLVESNEIGNNNIVLKYLDVINNEYNYVDIHRDLVDAKFIPVQKPVSFMEAVKTGRRIKVEHNLIDDILLNKKDIYFRSDSSHNRKAIERFRNKEFMPVNLLFSALGYLFDESEIAEIVNNGKWYIEEE